MTTLILPWNGSEPVVHPTAFVAPTASLIGDVVLGADVGVYFGAVIRADNATITIGAGSNVQDNVTLHVDDDFPVTIGAGVSIGHNAVVHGCTVEDDCLIGMGARVLNGARIGAGSLVAAGAVVLPGSEVPPGSLVAGVPGKVRRELSADDIAANRANAAHYVERSQAYRAALA